MDLLLRIKRMVFQGRIRYTIKALTEMAADDLEATEVEESILNAQNIKKILSSPRIPGMRQRGKLYVIESFSYTGALIYTKGKIEREEDQEFFYVFISAKISHGNG